MENFKVRYVKLDDENKTYKFFIPYTDMQIVSLDSFKPAKRTERITNVARVPVDFEVTETEDCVTFTQPYDERLVNYILKSPDINDLVGEYGRLHFMYDYDQTYGVQTYGVYEKANNENAIYNKWLDEYGIPKFIGIILDNNKFYNIEITSLAGSLVVDKAYILKLLFKTANGNTSLQYSNINSARISSINGYIKNIDSRLGEANLVSANGSVFGDIHGDKKLVRISAKDNRTKFRRR